VLLKVFNYNRDCAVIGVFNANYHAEPAARASLAGMVAPADAPDLAGGDFAAYAHEADRVWRCRRDERAPMALPEGGWEIVSYAPVDRGVAVLGLADKFNSTGAIAAKRWNADGTYTVSLRDGGAFLAWTERPPRAVEANGVAVAFQHDAAQGRLSATLPATGPVTLVLRW
jgi:raffinose synthase